MLLKFIANCLVSILVLLTSVRTDVVDGESYVIFRGLEDVLENGKTYRIDSFGGLTLTAKRDGRLIPSQAVLTTWAETLEQQWEANRIEQGFLLTPHRNDYNDVTYFLEEGASANHVWNIGRSTVADPKNASAEYYIRNEKFRCLEGQSEEERIEMKHCNPLSRNQRWKFYKLEFV